MQIQIKKYNTKSLYNRPEILTRLYELTNIGGKDSYGSGMQEDLDARKKGTIFLAWYKGKIIGWCSIHRVSRWKPVSYKQINCYVDRKYRKKKVGTRLVAKGAKWARKNRYSLRALPWNSIGDRLYKSQKVIKIDLV